MPKLRRMPAFHDIEDVDANTHVVSGDYHIN